MLADRSGRVLSVGYNGVASGMPHCNEREEFECSGVGLPRGQDYCEAVHAEQNALLQCRDPSAIHAAYVTLSPCRSCVKLLLNTPCQIIVFSREFDDPFPKSLWEGAGRKWIDIDSLSATS